MKVAEVQLTYKTNIKSSEREKINDSKSTDKLLRPFYDDYMEHREASFAVLLSRANRVLGVIRLSEGGVSGTVIDVKILFQSAILSNASGIIISHNHPSGNLTASSADLSLTKKIAAAGKLLDIQLLDHLIITDEGYYSLADEGLIQ